MIDTIYCGRIVYLGNDIIKKELVDYEVIGADFGERHDDGGFTAVCLKSGMVNNKYNRKRFSSNDLYSRDEAMKLIGKLEE